MTFGDLDGLLQRYRFSIQKCSVYGINKTITACK